MSEILNHGNPDARRRGVWPVSKLRAERLEIPAPLAVVAIEAKIPAATLSLGERGLKPLSREQETRVREAIARLRAKRREEMAG